jgi:hypothetical protein
MTIEKHYDKIVEVCLEVGERRVSKLQEHPRVMELYGLTGLRTRHFLNALLSQGNVTFLELGIYRGASLTCALYKNPEAKVYAVDNWHWSGIDHPTVKYELDKDGNPTSKFIPWPNVKLAALDNLKKYTTNKINLIEKNYTDLKKSDIPDPVEIIHLHTIPSVSKKEMISYLNTLYPLVQSTFILIAEHHILPAVKEAIVEWAKDKKLTINSMREKLSDSLSNTQNWGGGIGAYVITKQDITK